MRTNTATGKVTEDDVNRFDEEFGKVAIYEQVKYKKIDSLKKIFDSNK